MLEVLPSQAYCGKSTPFQGCGTVAKQCARVDENKIWKKVLCGKSTPLQGCGTVAKQCARVVEKDMEKGVVIDTQTPVVIIL